MLIFCEECGEKYSFSMEDVDPEKKSFHCGKCGFLILLDYKERKKEKEADDTLNKVEEKASGI